MLKSYFQNASVSMTKEAYYEMCEALNSEPVEDEIPIEQGDFPIEVQSALEVYYMLRDEWDTMSGTYMGKNYAGFKDILEIMDIEKSDRKQLMDWIVVMDAARSKAISAAKPKTK